MVNPILLLLGLAQAQVPVEHFPRFVMRELVTGPALLATARHDLLYSRTTEVSTDASGNIQPQSRISKRIAWCVFSVTEGQLAGEPCRVIRWYAAHPGADLEYVFYVTAEGDLLRQLAKTTRPIAKSASVLPTESGFQVQVVDEKGRRAFETEVPEMKPFLTAFRKYEQGEKRAAIFDPFANKFLNYSVRLGSYFTDEWLSKKYSGRGFQINDQRLYLLENDYSFRCQVAEFLAFEPDIDLLRSPKG